MPMRLSGLMSGMDTESIIQQLVEAKKTKVTKAVKAQKSLKYKQDAWKDLNKQVLNLYNKSLSNMRFESSFIKKVTKVSNSSVVSVITGEGAMNSVQSLKVKNLAKSGYLTGAKLPDTVEVTDENGDKKEVEVTGKTTLGDLGFTGSGSIQVQSKSEGNTSIELGANTTIDSLISALKGAGLTANFDASNKRIHVAAKASGTKNDFDIIAKDSAGLEALKKLGLHYSDNAASVDYCKSILGADAFDENGDIKPGAIEDKIMAEQLAYKEELKKNKDTFGAAKTQILNKQSDLMNSIKSTLANDPAKTVWEDKFKDNPDKAKYDVTDPNFNYNNLSDEEKKVFNEALNEALDAAKADGKLNDDEKAALETLQKDWRTNAAELSSTENALKAIDEKLDPVTGKLKPAVKQEITKKIKDVAALYEQVRPGASGGQGSDAPKKTVAEDSHIILNGVDYYSDKNSLEVNGLTLTVNATTADGEEVTITTQDDTDGIYDMIKGFLKEYNALINKMDKMYNAESSKGYDPLTDEEKDAMSDSAIEEWETKIKDSILRKDSVLGTFSGVLKKMMMEGVEVNGKMMYLSNFGINTLNYFSAPDNERNAYHIDGDPDDENTSGNADKLKSMIANDPDTVVSFFTQLSKKMYNEMFEQMKAKEGYSSAMTVYDDKKMQSDYDDYTQKIKELEKKLADYEDKWYAKFAAMETALAKMQNNASAVTSLLGG